MNNNTFLCLISLFLVTISCENSEKRTTGKPIKVGIIADCQYCDCDIKWNRYYKKSPNRLKEAVLELNKYDLSYTIHLGDFIDKDFKSFDSISPTWDMLKSKSYHVLGNHDFEVADSLKYEIPEKLGIKDRYYSFEIENWKFIVLDGTDLSTYGSEINKIEEAKKMLSSKENDSLPYAMFYNGGLSSEQMKWVEQELEIAKSNNQFVGFYCHFPANPIDNHNFWNVQEFLELIENYSNVKVFMNGHNHAGNYTYKNGVHFITFKGMVDTENETAFARLKITNDSLFINGYGRELDRTLNLN